ncbi:hypothetical protein BH11PLA2_BH11PLA2_27830 [soil metagenome]
MNKLQRNILICTAAIVALLVLFPPYVVIYERITVKSGYGFVFYLPPIVLPSGRVIPAAVEVTTLFALITGAVIVGGLLCIAFKSREVKPVTTVATPSTPC